MKILLINDYIDQIGGAERFCLDLKRELEKKGHIVLFIGGKKPHLFSRFFSIYWYMKTKRTIKKFKPDMVHINNFSRNISPSPILAALNKKIPIVITLHDYHLYCPLSYATTKKNELCPGCSIKCIYNCKGKSNQIFYNFLKWLKIKFHRKFIKNKNIYLVSPSKKLAKCMGNSINKHIEIIENGINIKNIKKHLRYKKKIMFVGRIDEEKGLQDIAPILNSEYEYKTVVLGEGKLKEKLKKEYKNIKFIGFKNPFEYYKHSSILVFSSKLEENFPYSIIEAMGSGLAVIATNTGGVPELIKSKNTGLLFKRGDKKDFEIKLNYLINNPLEIRRIGENARLLILKKFTSINMVNSYEKLYNKIKSNN